MARTGSASSGVSASRPACGPSRRPTATARLSSTTGEGQSWSRTSYSPTISVQSVSCQVGASACTAAIAASTAYRVGGLRRRATVTRATPSLMSRVSQRPRSCSESSCSRPLADRRLSSRAWMSSSSASRPLISVSVGMSRCSMRARLIALSTRSRRTRCAPLGAVWPVVKIRWTTSRTALTRPARWSGDGTRYGMRAVVIFFLARVIRAAIVGSGTRNARATSAVDSPHTSRSVSATWASRDRAG